MSLKSSKRALARVLALSDVKINGNRPWDIQIKNDKFYSRMLAEGSMALGEGYMDGWWDVKELDQFFCRLFQGKMNKRIRNKVFWSVLKAKLFNMQSKLRSKKVAQEHYDIGNDFYTDMLDKRMLYTCAYYKNSKTLDKAQEDKLDLICRKIKLKKGDKVLDIGCGWGSFAKYAAEKYKCQITSVNISKEQIKYVRENCKGLPVTPIHGDYRDVKGKFDKVVAIGLMEHIGYKNYRGLMKLAHKWLKKHGIFFVHTIANNTSVKMCDPWFDKYIFPNGVLPSVKQMGEAMEGLFVMEDWHNFGPDYDKTLVAWFKNFDKNWDKYKSEYGERFYRMWKYYLLSLAGGFRARHIQLWQIVLSKEGIPGRYDSVR